MGKQPSKQPSKPFQVGRDARTGEFITVEEARRRRSTAVVETIRPSKPKK